MSEMIANTRVRVVVRLACLFLVVLSVWLYVPAATVAVGRSDDLDLGPPDPAMVMTAVQSRRHGVSCAEELTSTQTRRCARRIAQSIRWAHESCAPYEKTLADDLLSFWDRGALDPGSCSPESRVKRFTREFVLATYRDVFITGRKNHKPLPDSSKEADDAVKGALLDKFIALLPNVPNELPFDAQNELLNRQRQVFELAASLAQLEEVERLSENFRLRAIEGLESARRIILSQQADGEKDVRIGQIDTAVRLIRVVVSS